MGRSRTTSEDRDIDVEEVAAIYDDLLSTYELEWHVRGHRSLHLALYDEDHTDPGAASINAMRVLSEAADIRPGERVLNIGCGAGEDSVWNARAHDATVVGVNISESQLELARENAREHDVADTTEFRFDDFHHLETIEEGDFDVVWGLEALSHADDLPRVISQARRVLLPGGRVAFSDLFLREEPNSSETVASLRTIEDALGVRIGTIDALEEALENEEFQNIERRDETEGVRPATKRRRDFARIAHPVSRVLVRLGLASVTQRDALAANARIHDLVRQEVLGYFVVTAELSPS